MNRDKLIDALVSTLNKKNKGLDIAHLLGEAGDKAASAVKDWISTGSTLLDLAVSNKKNGGIASGRVTELTGLEATGKSLIGAHILASTQKMKGIAVYIDTESAVSIDFLKIIGIDINKLIYINLDTVEDIYQTIEDLIIKIRESDKNKLVTILVDSMSAASTKVEMEAEYDKDGWATSKAIINSKAMRKITNMLARERISLILTNQLRTRLGVQFGEKYTTSGGLAIGFHASTRIKLTKATKIKDKNKEIIGLFIRAEIKKSRFGPSYRKVEFPLYFSSGIDDESSWLQYLKDKKIITTGGAWYTLNYKNKDIKFLSKDWHKKLEETTGLKEYLYDLICDSFIMKYEFDEDKNLDNIEITNEEVGE